jgi:hypothetical protein
MRHAFSWYDVGYTTLYFSPTLLLRLYYLIEEQQGMRRPFALVSVRVGGGPCATKAAITLGIA